MAVDERIKSQKSECHNCFLFYVLAIILTYINYPHQGNGNFRLVKFLNWLGPSLCFYINWKFLIISQLWLCLIVLVAPFFYFILCLTPTELPCWTIPNFSRLIAIYTAWYIKIPRDGIKIIDQQSIFRGKCPSWLTYLVFYTALTSMFCLLLFAIMDFDENFILDNF